MNHSNTSWLSGLADFLIRQRLVILAVAVVLTVLAQPIAEQLSFDQSIESLYSEDDPHFDAYAESKTLFGGDEFIIVAYKDSNLFQEDGRQLTEASATRLSEFAARLSDVDGIQADSTQTLLQALRFPYKRDRVKQLVRGILLGDDDQTTAVILRLLPEEIATIPRGDTFAKVRQIAHEHNPPAFVVGEAVQVHDMFRYVEDDGRVLFQWSLVLLGLVILILFRSLRWVILPLIVVLATIRWTEATLVLSQMKLSMVSSMLNSLVTIISIATVTHVTVHYRELRSGLDRTSAFRQTFIELAPAIFWTCATTAVGFLALMSSHITPVRSFGIMMALGTLFVLLSAASFLPGGILLGGFSVDPGNAPAERRLVGALGAVTGGIERWPKRVGITALLLVLFAALGFRNLQVETDFSKNFRESSSIVKSLSFVEDNLGGAGTWEVNFPAPTKLDEEYLDRVTKLKSQLEEQFGGDGDGQLKKQVSLSDGLQLVPKLPSMLNTLQKRLNALQALQNEYESSLYNSEQGRMRIVLRARERQPSASKLQLITNVRNTANAEFPGAKTTGLFVLLAFMIESLLRDQLVSFALAAVGIGLMMTVAFRSLRIGLVSLVPNLFPIVLVIGMMGWIGMPINIATAMIASVSMGLTVDSSIHYISAYRRARRNGMSVSESLHATHTGVGRALVFANIALIVGFSVLTLSHFIPLIYFGILVSVAMVGGLAGNLVLLPLLLRMIETDS